MINIIALLVECRDHTDASYLAWSGNDAHVSADVARSSLRVGVSLDMVLSHTIDTTEVPTAPADSHRSFLVQARAQVLLLES
jgi:hypothetical protein